MTPRSKQHKSTSKPLHVGRCEDWPKLPGRSNGTAAPPDVPAAQSSAATAAEYIPPHKFEVLYFIGRYGGPHRAARNMPYGVTPSALSRKLCELERLTQLVLYERQTHQLTRPGNALFNLHKAMFEESPRLIKMLRQGMPDTITLGAAPVVQREYLPPILARLQGNFPHLQITCLEGSQRQIQGWLANKQIDLAVTIVEESLLADYEAIVLARLPLHLLVPAKSKLRSAAELWRRQPIAEKLIRFEDDNPISQYFCRGLERRGIQWPAYIRVTSTELVEAYVARNLGVGLALAMPGHHPACPGVRALPLKDFPRLPVGLVWRVKHSAPTRALLKELCRAAKQLMICPGIPRGFAHGAETSAD